MKKLIIAFMLLFTLAVPSMTEAKGFSGGHSTFSHTSSHSYSTRSGFKSSSTKVYRTNQSSKRSSFWSHAAAFGAGTFFGSMFHPFGGHYYGHPYGFSMFGLLVDILIIFIIIRVLKGIFRRRRY